MKFRAGDSQLSMSVIRAAQVAAEVAAGLSEQSDDAADVTVDAGAVEEVKAQYVFTMTDGGFAKRTRISDYRLQSRGGLGIKAMSLANEDRGGLVGAFIVVDGDEILSITQGGQVVRSPINDEFRPTGRSTMGVKFVTPKSGDAVAVVTRSVEAKDEDEAAEAVGADGGPEVGPDAGDVVDAEIAESSDVAADATIDETTSVTTADPAVDVTGDEAADEGDSEG
jgi:DNA gyrase subunit A